VTRPGIPTGMSLRERLARQYTVHPSGCWLWTGAMNKVTGYGQIKLNYKTLRAHRASYEVHVGPIPPGMIVCHSCDNPPCVNPAHLFLGTHRDNTRDKLRKGRANLPVGEGHTRSRLTAAAVREIRTSGETGRALARKFGVSPATICRAKRGHLWRTVT
jgi:hypothetical protein